MEEWETSGIPWDSAEFSWQHHRPVHLWTPIPPVGSDVFYRSNHWEPETLARVLAHQDDRDYTDFYLWKVITNENRAATTDGFGKRMIERVEDPWICLTLKTEWGVVTCREARLRGSAGWLPLDWKTRFRPNPYKSIPSSARVL